MATVGQAVNLTAAESGLLQEASSQDEPEVRKIKGSLITARFGRPNEDKGEFDVDER